MKNISFLKPYIYGGLSGILLIWSVLITEHFLGASTTYVKEASDIKEAFAPIIEGNNKIVLSYFEKYSSMADWQLMFLIGIILGSLISALFGKEFKLQSLPDRWKDTFGESVKKRLIFAFIGGAISMFGARLAGGCPSGHGLSGFSQLSVSGLIALPMFFISAIIMAHLVYKRKELK